MTVRYSIIRKDIIMATNEKTRFIRTVTTTYSDIVHDSIDKKVNGAIRVITGNGGKVVSILQSVPNGIGVSTVYTTYTIIYEAVDEIPPSVFKKGCSDNEQQSDRQEEGSVC